MITADGWARSSRCVQGDCLEARRVDEVVVVRDSKLGNLVLQRWTDDEWQRLLAAVVARGPVGIDDDYRRLVGHVGCWPPIGQAKTGVDIHGAEVRLGMHRHETLTFTFEEWNAFVAGVLAGEFNLDVLKASAGTGVWTAGDAGSVRRGDGSGLAATGADGPPGAPVAASGPGPTVAPGVSDEVAAHRHDAATVPAAGEVACLPSSAAPEAGPLPVDPVSFILSTEKGDLDPSAVGESYLPGAALSDSPAGWPDPPSGETVNEACAPKSPPASRGPGEPSAQALVDLSRPERRDPWDSTDDEWAREWAIAAYWTGVAAGMAMQRAHQEGEVPAWGSGALVRHITEQAAVRTAEAGPGSYAPGPADPGGAW